MSIRFQMTVSKIGQTRRYDFIFLAVIMCVALDVDQCIPMCNSIVRKIYMASRMQTNSMFTIAAGTAARIAERLLSREVPFLRDFSGGLGIGCGKFVHRRRLLRDK